MTEEGKKERIVIEESARLSTSLIWQLQIAAYSQFGADAWASKQVPSYITSNPYIARQYAHVVLGYIRDCLRTDAPVKLDLSEPLYIFDLGAGTGRFGYLFLKTLHQLLAVLGSNQPKIIYVLTDVIPANIEFWMEHPFMQGFLREGMLDAASYWHGDTGQSLTLKRSGKVLTPENIRNPLIVLANYFFDTIPHDMFYSIDGKLHESRYTFFMDKNEETIKLEKTDPAVIGYLEYQVQHVPIASIDDYYHDWPELNAFLKLYAQCFDRINFQFPIGPFQTIRFFRELSHGRMFLLAGDQGKSTADHVRRIDGFLAKHSSFSMSVNYHAISSYFRELGGVSFLTTYPDPRFIVFGGALGGRINYYSETALAFREHIDYFEPNEYMLLVECSEKEWKEPDMEYMLLLIKLGNWDPTNFNFFMKRLLNKVHEANPRLKDKLFFAIDKVWENFYPTSKDEGAFVMNLGVLMYNLLRFDRALEYFLRAQEIGFDEELLYRNISACYSSMNQPAIANEYRIKADKRKKNS